MKTAVSVHNNRIAPVFDVAVSLLILNSKADEIIAEKVQLPGDCKRTRIGLLKEMGISTLICGAITSHSLFLAETEGIKVIAFTAGDVSKVLKAYGNNELVAKELFLMPGCRRGCCGRKWGGLNRLNKQEEQL